MAIITLAEAKTRMRITGSDYDTFITAVIPDAQDFIMEMCNNRFHQPIVTISGSTIAFVDSGPDTITDSDENFLEGYFADNMDIDVENTINNDGVFHADTAVAGTLTLAATDELIAEEAGITVVKITRVRFPRGIKTPTAGLIKYYLNSKSISPDDKDVTRVKIGSFEEEYGGDFGSTSFPKSLLTEFSPWMRIGMV